MGAKRRPDPTRFWARVRVTNACWLWTGDKDGKGYGRFQLGSGHANRTWTPAHRWAYESMIGPIPDGLQLDHTCHHPDECYGGKACPHRGCVNPAHVEPVTSAENKRRGNAGIVNRMKTHCPRGHPYDEENTYRPPSRPPTHRICRTCYRRQMREGQRRYQARLRAEAA